MGNGDRDIMFFLMIMMGISDIVGALMVDLLWVNQADG